MPKFSFAQFTMRAAIAVIVFGSLATVLAGPLIGLTVAEGASQVVTAFIAIAGGIAAHYFPNRGE